MKPEHSTQAEQMKDEILAKIEAGEVTMKSKLHFGMRWALLITTILAICIIAICLVTYILFSLHVSGRFMLLGFGAKGWRTFFHLFPWHLFLLEFLLILILGGVLKHFRFGYRHPALYIILATIGLSISIGMGINHFPFHDRLLQQYEQGKLPAGAKLYEKIRVPTERPDIFQGTIINVNDDNFTIAGPRGPQNVEVPRNVNPGEFLSIGDKVFVAGEITNGHIRAYGIRKLN